MSIGALFWAIEDVSGVTSTEKLVLIALANYADDQGIAHPALYTLERITGLTERGIRKTLRGLEEKALIATAQRAGFTSAYRLALPTDRLGAKRQPRGGNVVPPSPVTPERTPEQTPERTPEQTPEPGSPEPITSNHLSSTRPREASEGTGEKQGPHLLPADWEPSEQGKEYARRKGIDWAYQATKVRNWADQKKARYADWQRFWVNWIDKAAEDEAGRKRTQPVAVRWADCAPTAPAKSKAKRQDPRIQPRLQILNRWTEGLPRRAPMPSWLGTPAAVTLPADKLVADLDAWIAATAEMNRIPVPAMPGSTQPALLAAE